MPHQSTDNLGGVLHGDLQGRRREEGDEDEIADHDDLGDGGDF